MTTPINSFRNFHTSNPNRGWSGNTYHISQNRQISLDEKIAYIHEFISHYQSQQDQYGHPRIEILGRDANTPYNHSVFDYSIISVSGAHIDELLIELPQVDPLAYLEEINALNSIFVGAKAFTLDDFLNVSTRTYSVVSSAPMSLRKKLLNEFIDKKKSSRFTFSESVDGATFNVVSSAINSLMLFIGLNRDYVGAEVLELTIYFQNAVLQNILANFKKYRTDKYEYTIKANLPIEERKRILTDFFYTLPQGGKSFFDEDEAVRLYVNLENTFFINFIVELSGENEEQRETERYYLKDISARQIG